MEKDLQIREQTDFMAPNRFQQMLAVSEFLSKSDLIPAHFRGKAANVFIALDFSLRQDMSPFMVMQNLYVVHGRPGLEAKLVIALVNQNGKYDHELQYDIQKSPQGKILSCTAWTMKAGKRIDGPPVTQEMVSAEKWDQKKGDMASKWSTMPDLMFRYRAATYFARVNCPEVLKGLQTTEEVEDVVEMVQDGSFFTPLAQEEVDAGQDVFSALVQAREADPGKVQAFVEHCATVYKMSPEEVKAKASVNPDNFFGALEKWAEKQQPQEKKERKPRSDKGQPRKVEEVINPQAPTNGPATGTTGGQPGPVGVSEEQLAEIEALIPGKTAREGITRGDILTEIFQWHEVTALDELTADLASQTIDWLKK